MCLGVTLFLVLSGCSSEGDSVTGPVPTESARGVYVLNEGNFGRGNSTLSFYDPVLNTVFPAVFRSVNNRDLGDTGNDIAVHEGLAYIVVNFSDKLEIIDTGDHSSVATVSFPPGSNPYKIAIAPDLEKAYVTNLWDASVSVVDLTGLRLLTDKIQVGENPQGLAYAGGKVYVCNSGFGSARTVSVIDAWTDQVIKTLTLSDGPANIGVDSNGHLWIVCTGNFGFIDPSDETPGKLFVLDPTNDEVLDSIDVDGHPGEISFSSDGFAYVVGNLGIMKIDTRTAELIVSPFIPGSFYTVSIDEFSNDIYVCDAKDFQQNGTVALYSASGDLMREFEVGVGPGSVAFVR